MEVETSNECGNDVKESGGDRSLISIISHQERDSLTWDVFYIYFYYYSLIQ